WNPDVDAAINAGWFDSGQHHYETAGWSEGRNPHAGFDSAYYLAQNPDVAAALAAGHFSSPLQHYLLHGEAEGRLPRAGFRDGGFTGMGGLDQIMGVVHGQEFVAHAEATRRWRPQLEAMNAGTFGGTDNRELIQEIRELRRENARLTERLIEATTAG